MLFEIWVFGYMLVDTNDGMSHLFILWTVINILSVAMMVITTGCFLNETFDKFVVSLWTRYENERNDAQKLNVLSGFIHYIKCHQIQFTFGGIRVTKKSTCVFIIGFAVSKAIATLFGFLY